ncbi:MAG TPA: sugar ABC transporter ATP-binding protein [Acidimicrobiales bacterium]|nr:sugar ABC transporter ATP-binding protein [Acidimicrobiales bacterium]
MSEETLDGAPHRAAGASGDDLVVAGVSKRFGGVPALQNISVTIEAGKVHALIGENGAGKSTLGKIIAGVIAPDEGTVSLGGRALHMTSPRDGLTHGIVTIAQELAIVPGLTVADNVFLGAEIATGGFVRRRELRRRFRELAHRTGFELRPDTPAASLSTADKQKVEIMRALSRQASIVVMDEPSAALSSHEITALHGIIRSLAASGTAVILISHFLSEVLALSDTITTLRDGHLVQTVDARGATQESLIEGMLGRPLSATFPERRFPAHDAPVVLEVDSLCAPRVENCSFSLRRGEILGVAGLVGAGRSELARAIFRDAKVSAGSVRLGGDDLSGHNPRRSIHRGLVMIPESRKELGLMMGRSVRENVSLSRLDLVSRLGWVSRIRERRAVASLMERTTVKAASMSLPATMLSGGNQQKLLFARSMMKTPAVLIADEPTRGVDVGSKRAIYDLLVEMAREGMGIIVISSELEEVLGLAHRVLVMRHGRISAELAGQDISEEAVLEAAFTENSAS